MATRQEVLAKVQAELIRIRGRMAELLADLDVVDDDGAPPRLYVTSEEYAASLKVTADTVRKWSKLGMPHVRVGNRLRVIPEKADAWRAIPRRDRETRPGMVYIARRASDGAIKVGFSRDTAKRMASLATQERCAVTLLAAWSGGLEDEAELHARYHAHRIHGEWFREEGPVADLVARFTRGM